MIRVSDRVFELVLADQSRIRAVWASQDVVALRDLLSHRVVIEGRAVFRPSGSLLRVETEAIAEATDRDAFFSKMPQPASGTRVLHNQARKPPGTRNGFAAIYGQWPGEETEEKMLATLEEMS